MHIFVVELQTFYLFLNRKQIMRIQYSKKSLELAKYSSRNINEVSTLKGIPPCF